MPQHIAPFFRNREVSLEALGLLPKVSSDGYSVIVSEENSGKRGKFIPIQTFHFNGTPSTSRE